MNRHYYKASKEASVQFLNPIKEVISKRDESRKLLLELCDEVYHRTCSWSDNVFYCMGFKECQTDSKVWRKKFDKVDGLYFHVPKVKSKEHAVLTEAEYMVNNLVSFNKLFFQAFPMFERNVSGLYIKGRGFPTYQSSPCFYNDIALVSVPYREGDNIELPDGFTEITLSEYELLTK